MPRDLYAPAHPCRIVPLDVVHEARQCISARRPANEARVEANRHHLWLPLTLAMELIECGPEIGEEILPRYPPRVGGELEVIGVKSIGNNEPRLAVHPNPVREIVVVGIGVV